MKGPSRLLAVLGLLAGCNAWDLPAPTGYDDAGAPAVGIVTDTGASAPDAGFPTCGQVDHGCCPAAPHCEGTLSCLSGTCLPVACGQQYADCLQGVACCSQYSCRGNFSHASECCVEVGQVCNPAAGTHACCGQLTCPDGGASGSHCTCVPSGGSCSAAADCCSHGCGTNHQCQ